MLRTLLLIFAGTIYSLGYAQTCCTGGAPMTGSFRLTSMDKGQVGVNITGDFNFIRDFYLEGDALPDDYIRRFTHTLFSQLDFGVSDRGTLTLLLPYVWLNETVSGANGANTSGTSGIGDLTFSYNQLFTINQNSSLFAGAGVKLPTGATSKTNQDGIILQATLQPGTGSFDYFANIQYQAGIPFRRSMIFRGTLTYRRNTETNRFTFHDSYKFGDEIQVFSGLSDQVIFGNAVHSPNFTLRYRYQAMFQVEGSVNENTGGHWVTAIPGWQVQASDRILAGVSAELPVFRHLNGFQITTTYKIIVNLSYNISTKKNIAYGF